MLVPSRRRSTGTPQTSSLADIAFLLLIFFLVTTVFDEERGIGIVLPRSGAETPVPPANLLQLQVLPDGAVDVIRGSGPQVQRVRADQVATLWRLEAAESPGLIAAIRTHPDAPYHRMVDVLDALRVAGAERISLQRLER
jgi:biopolymer transport protein ExbD